MGFADGLKWRRHLAPFHRFGLRFGAIDGYCLCAYRQYEYCKCFCISLVVSALNSFLICVSRSYGCFHPAPQLFARRNQQNNFQFLWLQSAKYSPISSDVIDSWFLPSTCSTHDLFQDCPFSASWTVGLCNANNLVNSDVMFFFYHLY